MFSFLVELLGTGGSSLSAERFLDLIFFFLFHLAGHEKLRNDLQLSFPSTRQAHCSGIHYKCNLKSLTGRKPLFTKFYGYAETDVDI